jgi:hypothetical protein
VALAFLVGLSGLSLAGGLPEGKLDEQDPEAAEIRKLDYEGVVYAKEDLKTRVTALIGLNELLNRVGKRSAARLKMLGAYIKARDLKEALLKSESPVPEVGRLKFEDGQKIAVAFVKTEKGAAMFGPRLPKVSDAAELRYEASYLKLCRKRWAEVAYTRHEIEAIAVFLDARGKFQEYMKWAAAEALREKARGEAAFREGLKKQDEAEKARRKLARQRAHERELKRMEYAFKLKEAKLKAAGGVAEARYRSENEDWNTWGGYYYRDGHVVRRRRAREKAKDRPRAQPVKPRPRAPRRR